MVTVYKLYDEIILQDFKFSQIQLIVHIHIYPLSCILYILKTSSLILSSLILLEIQLSRAGDVIIRAPILLLQECELKKMPPERKVREAFFSIHMTGVGGFASQILTSYALDRCIYIKYSLCDLI